MIPKFIENKIKSEFLKNVLTLLSGSVLAQLIVVLVSPILTRLYAPEDFGASALFMSISTILVIITTGRYEMAIVQTKKDYDGLSLVLISLIICSFFAIFFLSLYLLLSEIEYLNNLNNQLNGYLWLIPIYVLINVIFKTFTNYFNRNKYYKTIASNQINLSISQSTVKVTFGFFNLSSNGLILGTIIGQFITSSIVVFKFYKNYFDFKRLVIGYKRIKINMIKFKSYPKVLLFSDGINVIASQLPFMLTSYYFSLEKLGYLALAYSMSSIPLTFVGRSITKVFRQRMSEEYNKTGKCDLIFLKVLKKLVLFLSLPFIALFFIAPFLFATVFGEIWKESGEIVQLLVVMFYFQFIARTFNYMYLVSDHHKENLYLQIYILLGVILSFSIGFEFFDELEPTLLIFSITYSLIYIYSIFQSFKYSKGEKSC